MSKLESILTYIEKLPMGEKISVRKLARTLVVSEGTAYRAIKEAKERGMVATMDRVGTIRLRKMHDTQLDWLNFHDVVKMVAGEVLGGSRGLSKNLTGFIIGAMKVESMRRFLVSGALMIVGNRDNVHRYAIENNLAVLITGGFGGTLDTIQFAEERDIPIIRTQYDTFTVAKIINEAIYHHTVKQELLLIDSLVKNVQEVGALKNTDTREHYVRLKHHFGLQTYAVINYQRKIVGIVSQKDLILSGKVSSIEKMMNKKVIFATLGESAIQVFQRMVASNLTEVPVVDNLQHFVGMLTKKDLLSAISLIEKNDSTDTLFEKQGDAYILEVTSDLVNAMGAVSYGTLTDVLTRVAQHLLKDKINVLESLAVHYLETMVLGNVLTISPKILRQNRIETILQIEMKNKETITATATLVMKNTEMEKRQ